MRSIFLNKSIQSILISAFLLSSQALLGQDIVNLSSTDKSETKQFLQKLVSIYGKDLKKINSQPKKDNESPNVTSDNKDLKDLKKLLNDLKNKKFDPKLILLQHIIHHETNRLISIIDSIVETPINRLDNNNYVELVYSKGAEYEFSFNLDLSNTSLLFSLPKVIKRENAYLGESENLERLFGDLHKMNSAQISDTSISNRFMRNNITANLYNDPSFIKHHYNRLWRKYRRPDRLTLGVFGGVNFSTAFVSPFQYSDDAELKTQTRRENEEYLPTGIYGFSAGYSRYSHGVDVFFQRTNHGTKYVRENIIDWNTGYYGGDSLAPDSTKLSFPVGQWGIRYRYSNYHRKISPYVAVGIHISYVKMSSKDLLQLNSQYLSTGCNLGLGLNIHPIYALDIHIAPVMNISFNAVKGSELQTRFSSIALEVGLRYNIALGKK